MRQTEPGIWLYGYAPEDSPHAAHYIECEYCGYTFGAVAPVGLTDIPCPECGISSDPPKEN